MMIRLFGVLVVFTVAIALIAATEEGQKPMIFGAIKSGGETSTFSWRATEPLVAPVNREDNIYYSVKDPSIVQYDGMWHLFCTVRGKPRSHAIEYLRFKDWKDANTSERVIVPAHSGYFCAPQVFYFRPHKKWYLICQAASESWDPQYQPAYSTSDDVSDPRSWSEFHPLGAEKPKEAGAWLDFWVICDDQKAYLFYTSLDGKMWRSETDLSDFPHGWSAAKLALQGDIFEAGHIYRLRDREEYLALIEAQNGHGWRYFKAYVTDRLDGNWRPLAADRDNAFASMKNVEQPSGRWTDSISHGELIRAGYDERMEVDPSNLRFVFQGVLDKDRQGKSYGEIPWRLGILESLKTEDK